MQMGRNPHAFSAGIVRSIPSEEVSTAEENMRAVAEMSGPMASWNYPQHPRSFIEAQGVLQDVQNLKQELSGYQTQQI